MWAYSDDNKFLVPEKQSQYGKYTFPYEFARGELPKTGNDDYEMSGSYKMILEAPQMQVLEFMITLEAKTALLKRDWYYQIYMQI